MIKMGKFHDRGFGFFFCRFFFCTPFGFFFSSSESADSSVGELLLLSILNGFTCFFLPPYACQAYYFLRCLRLCSYFISYGYSYGG
jgi:hypothetical protein